MIITKILSGIGEYTRISRISGEPLHDEPNVYYIKIADEYSVVRLGKIMFYFQMDSEVISCSPLEATMFRIEVTDSDRDFQRYGEEHFKKLYTFNGLIDPDTTNTISKKILNMHLKSNPNGKYDYTKYTGYLLYL